jgi:hypothetical protein
MAKPMTDAIAAKYARAVPIAAAPIAIATRAPAAQGVMLPRTATDAELRMILGFILVFLSLIIMARLRWRAGLTWR